MRVRVCVECGEEYRPEIEACADCGGRLEDRDDQEMGTASPASGAPAEDELDAGEEDELADAVMHAERAPSLTAAADRLAREGIAFRIRPGEHGYDLRVAAADRDQALSALGLHAEGGRAGECPACETPLPVGAVECPECGLAAGDDPDPD